MAVILLCRELFKGEALALECLKGRVHMPVASVTHFLVKLVFAAPASFLSAACESQLACASFVHLVMKLVFAAPASFFAPDWSAHESAIAAVVRQNEARMIATVFIVSSYYGLLISTSRLPT